MKTKIEIKNRFTGKILFEFETENNTVQKTVVEAIEKKANLSEADLSKANLSEADLSKADLSWANLSWANLSEANLSKANLSWANLSWADLSKADLSWANLSLIKEDLFLVLLRGIKEIPALKDAINTGKIDGSCYDGECCCLSGTLVKGAPTEHINSIMSVRDSYRPIEKFFMAISPGHTPETNPASKLAIEWIEEFERLIK